ncbi:MAG: beta-ketoacyl-[acyl-carrier-protein] synthase family protein [Candidatus Omnitrophica bacterium]|nr:beta-ketoacyl-[acyl-carrier-protein] synthase family protein [Candidatus Omnitrophota bacterium]
MKKSRTVITGIGVISPIGIGKDEYWQSIMDGKSGFKPITLFDTSDLKVKIGGEISNFNPKQILNTQNIMDLDRATLLLSSAVKLAIDDAKLDINETNTKQIGVSVGTTFGSLHSISEFDKESLREGPRYVNPSVFPSTVGNSPASRIGIRFKIKGFNSTISTGMCAALDALDYARDFINLGRTNTVVTGAVEDFCIQTFLGFYKLNYLSGLNGDPEPLSCPFDKRRNGIIFSEGSTVLILEELDSAKKRKANIYAQVLGIGSCFDPIKFYRFNPKGEGMVKAMQLALADANLKPEDIDCIFANANSTKDADRIETKAIKDVFGNFADEVCITAPKSILGETFSASGGLSTVAAIGALNKDLIPPTINYQEKDPDCNLNYVTNKSRKNKLNRIMINAFGPNGANTVVIIGKLK